MPRGFRKCVGQATSLRTIPTENIPNFPDNSRPSSVEIDFTNGIRPHFWSQNGVFPSFFARIRFKKCPGPGGPKILGSSNVVTNHPIGIIPVFPDNSRPSSVCSFLTKAFCEQATSAEWLKMRCHGTQTQRKVPQGCAAVLLQAGFAQCKQRRLCPETQLLVHAHGNVVPKENTNLPRTHTKQLGKHFSFWRNTNFKKEKNKRNTGLLVTILLDQKENALKPGARNG
jgi:hypothetical protein